MKPLLVLVATFALSASSLKFATGEWHAILAGNIAMAGMLLFTAVGHFVFTKGMIRMLPEFVPFKQGVIYLTGIIEVGGAVGLLIGSLRGTTAIGLIVFFVLLLPANIYAALNKVDYQTGTYEGPGVSYLWFRVPLQVFFIAWVCYFSL